MTKVRYFLFGAISTSSLVLATTTPAFAQSTGNAKPRPSSDQTSGDIIVTARRSEERLQDVPISITVLSQQDINNRNIINASDLGSYVPSLASNTRYGADKVDFSIRGFVTEGKTSPTVGVYFADVIAPRANGGTESGNGAGAGDFMDLQDVQVLKGPQGTLFGRNTTGGAILLVPQKPKDRFEGYVEESLGDYNLRRFQSVVNVPLSDTFRVRAAVDWNQRDGYLHNRSGVGPTTMGNTDYLAARISIVGDLTPNLENYTIATYSKSKSTGVVPKDNICNPDSGFAYFACAQIARQNARGEGFWDVENSNPHPYENFLTWRVINTTTWRAGDDITVKNIASYAEFTESSSFSLWGDNFLYPTANPAIGGPLYTIGIQINPGYSGKNAAQSTFTEELQLQGRVFDGGLNWQAGAYLELSKPLGFSSSLNEIFINCTNALAFQCTGPGFGSLSAIQDETTFNNKGLYAQGTYKLSEKLSLTGGARYTLDRMTDLAEYASIAVPTPGVGIISCSDRINHHGATLADPLIVASIDQCTDYFKISSNRPTWLIDLDYKPVNDVLIYSKWSRGYRQGFINPNNLGIETVGPEKVDTFEVGSKTSFHGPIPGFFSIAGFYNNFRNQQLAVNAIVAPAFEGIISPASPIVNAGKSRIFGLEVDASVKPFAGMKVDVGYAYLNTKLLSFNPPPVPIYYSALLPASNVGQPLALAPKNRITLTGTYSLPVNEAIGQISLGATFTHTDANPSTTLAASPNYLVAASNMLDLSANWNSVFRYAVDLSFFMTNATNEKLYAPTLQGYNYVGIDGANVNLPRMFGFRLKYRFGS